jgi:hypothetical protein
MARISAKDSRVLRNRLKQTRAVRIEHPFKPRRAMSGLIGAGDGAAEPCAAARQKQVPRRGVGVSEPAAPTHEGHGLQALRERHGTAQGVEQHPQHQPHSVINTANDRGDHTEKTKTKNKKQKIKGNVAKKNQG